MKRKEKKYVWKYLMLIFDEIGKLGEGEGFGDFNFKKFFSGFFKSKSSEEIENSLIVGTKKTTIIIWFNIPFLQFRYYL